MKLVPKITALLKGPGVDRSTLAALVMLAEAKLALGAPVAPEKLTPVRFEFTKVLPERLELLKSALLRLALLNDELLASVPAKSPPARRAPEKLPPGKIG